LAVPPEEIVERLNRIRRRSGILFTVETFERLIASGRVGRGRALLGSMLNVKPILCLDLAGKVSPVGKAVGRRRAMQALLDSVAREIPDGAHVRFGVVYVGADDIVAPVSEALRRRYGKDVEILTAPATPVLATHLGLGAWGLAYLVED
jgi:DegV family protein with EDD domain